MTARHFLELDGSAQRDAELDRWRSLSAADLGPVRASHRVRAVNGPTALLLLLVAATLVVLGLALTVAAALGAVPVAAVLVVGGLLGLPVVLLVVVATTQSWRREIVVRSEGVVAARRPIPFATMDPGRMVWATDLQAVRSVVTLNRRRLAAGGDVLLLTGTDGWSGEDDWRGLGTKYDQSPRSERLDSPFVWWCLGPRDVGALVGDLEAAMVAAGYPAAGLARRLTASRGMPPAGVEVYPRRRRYDPLLRG